MESELVSGALRSLGVVGRHVGPTPPLACREDARGSGHSAVVSPASQAPVATASHFSPGFGSVTPQSLGPIFPALVHRRFLVAVFPGN